MDAFESLVATLLRNEGYWTFPSFKVKLTERDRTMIGRISAPRWELDVLAYRGGTDELLVVECKSFLNSRGVVFRDGQFGDPSRYKLFADKTLQEVVLKRLMAQLKKSKMCPPSVKPRLGLAIGHLADVTELSDLTRHCERNGWELFHPDRLRGMMRKLASSGYENEVAPVALKMFEAELNPNPR